MTMKKFKYFFFAALTAAVFTACEDDTDLPPYAPMLLAEDFDEGADNIPLVVEGWTNYASEGTAIWKHQVFSGDGYAEFSSFSSGDAVNVGWLISKKVTLAADNDAVVRFLASHSFLTDEVNNKLEVFVSNDFDGTNVDAATWTELTPEALPTPDNDFYEYVDSGEMSLSDFSGEVYVALRVTGSGTNTSLDGSYQVDRFRIYEKQ
jgi:hypothetical protein